MHSRDRTPLRSRLRPFLLGHCFFSSFLLLCQAELQRSCSQLGSQRRGEHCQSLCHCRYYPPLPPPPPPPPPPRLLIPTVAESPVPLLRPWWMDFIVVVTVGCTSAFFLLLILLICFKAIKRQGPFHKSLHRCLMNISTSLMNDCKKAGSISSVLNFM
ncbi:proline-rich membrane anchor 1-like isoform X1 [Tachysurus fulvidraco]|uniref:proline-rich membrane anchor 1-like isoform X1 n=1 Tax=Tachysurus fulvidraco TaxID=1234273 RepID=UPI001FEF2767|nr:proline-rich membrane anchor 1-like isoform X1 [Tachysurus fulvidraco]